MRAGISSLLNTALIVRSGAASKVSRPSPAHIPVKGSRLSNILRTTDHKTIGLMYLATSFAWFVIGGLIAQQRPPGGDAPRTAIQDGAPGGDGQSVHLLRRVPQPLQMMKESRR